MKEIWIWISSCRQRKQLSAASGCSRFARWLPFCCAHSMNGRHRWKQSAQQIICRRNTTNWLCWSDSSRPCRARAAGSRPSTDSGPRCSRSRIGIRCSCCTRPSRSCCPLCRAQSDWLNLNPSKFRALKVHYSLISTSIFNSICIVYFLPPSINHVNFLLVSRSLTPQMQSTTYHSFLFFILYFTNIWIMINEFSLTFKRTGFRIMKMYIKSFLSFLSRLHFLLQFRHLKSYFHFWSSIRIFIRGTTLLKIECSHFSTDFKRRIISSFSHICIFNVIAFLQILE